MSRMVIPSVLGDECRKHQSRASGPGAPGLRRNCPCYAAPTVTTRPSKQLETFPNPRSGRDYHIAFECPEFTCLCPITGQPDFATISIDYVPDELCIELKSLKLYLWSYRDEGAFHEAVTNRICDDLVAAIAPRSITVIGKFLVRGGIGTTVTVTHAKG
jgi:7-cyano-7-deazaguanine reductase